MDLKLLNSVCKELPISIRPTYNRSLVFSVCVGKYTRCDFGACGRGKRFPGVHGRFLGIPHCSLSRRVRRRQHHRWPPSGGPRLDVGEHPPCGPGRAAGAVWRLTEKDLEARVYLSLQHIFPITTIQPVHVEEGQALSPKDIYCVLSIMKFHWDQHQKLLPCCTKASEGHNAWHTSTRFYPGTRVLSCKIIDHTTYTKYWIPAKTEHPTSSP